MVTKKLRPFVWGPEGTPHRHTAPLAQDRLTHLTQSYDASILSPPSEVGVGLPMPTLHRPAPTVPCGTSVIDYFGISSLPVALAGIFSFPVAGWLTVLLDCVGCEPPQHASASRAPASPDCPPQRSLATISAGPQNVAGFVGGTVPNVQCG